MRHYGPYGIASLFEFPHVFLYNTAATFDNNLNERDLRKCKNRQKMPGGFRAPDGAQTYCRIVLPHCECYIIFVRRPLVFF
jgi:hypothetical protein